MNDIRTLTVAELAEDAFLKNEHLKCLAAMNVPQEFDARKALAIQYAEAQAAAHKAQTALEAAIKNPGHS